MTAKRFTVLKKLETSDICADVIDTYIEKLVKEGKSVGWVTVGILDNGNPMTYKECVDLLNENEQLKEEVKSLREHFIYLIATALEDKECRKIYAEGLLEIFDDCNNLDEAKSKIKEYLE